MKKLQIDETQARELFPTASPDLKQLLISTFGQDHFKEKEWQKVTGYEAACKLDSVDPIEYLPYKDPQTPDDILTNAFKRLIMGQKMINRLDDNYKPIYGDSSNPKVYVWVDMRGGVGFSHTFDGCTFTHATVGSRFIFGSHETAKHFYNSFESDIKILQTLLNTI